MDWEQRIGRLEDRAAIDDLIVSYFLAADGDDFEGIARSFTEFAIFSSSGAINAEGRESIVNFIRSARGHMGLTVHTPHYAQLTLDGSGQASGLVGAHLELVLGGQAIYGAVRYVDTYVKQGAEWLISARDMRTIFMAPWMEAGAALASASPVRWPGAPVSVSDYPRKS